MSLSYFNLPRCFLYFQLVCQMLSYHWSTCSSVHNCFNLFFCQIQFNCQKGCVSKSTSDSWLCTPYSFPISSSEPSSVILSYHLSNFLFFCTGSWFALLRDKAVFALYSALQSRAWWLLFPHFMHLPSIFCLLHTSLGTNSHFFFSLCDSAPLNCILSSRPYFFPWLLVLLSCSFLWNLVVIKFMWRSFSFHLDGSQRRTS